MTLDKKFYPGLNRVLVLKDTQKVEESGLLLTAPSSVESGTLEAVGSIKDGNGVDSTTFKVGDKVKFLPQSGMNIDIDGVTYRLMSITEILVGERHD